ncbi:fungal-specific transcription factor domain-containing protein [Aspergillus insuetus]
MSGSETPQVGEERCSKRQRTAIACDSCRTRKTRCDGMRPSCGMCLDMEFNCQYTKRRGRHKSGGVAEPTDDAEESASTIQKRLDAMEKLLLSVLSRETPTTVRGSLVSSPQSRAANTTALLHKDTSSPTEYDTRNIPLEDSISHDDTVDGMGLVTFAEEAASIYFGLSAVSEGFCSRTHSFSGPTSNSAFLEQIIQAISLNSEKSISAKRSLGSMCLNPVSRPPSPHSHPPHASLSTDQPSWGHDIYALPSHGRIIELVDAFFSRPGMLFPYIYKKWVLNELGEGPLIHLHAVRRSWLCLLNAIMAFAAALGDGRSRPTRNCTEEADVFLQRALKLLPDLAKNVATLETLQALLILTQCLQSTRRSSQFWYLHRLTLQAAFQVGVQSAKKTDDYSPLVKELRKRAWYMCFIIDKTCSMTFGRPPAIPNSYMSQELPLEIDLEVLETSHEMPMESLQQLQPQNSSASLYIESIKLYQLIGEIINDIYNNNVESDAHISNSDLLKRVISIEQRLDEWKLNLPPNLRVRSKEEVMHDLADPSVSINLSIVITMRYLIARILLHRPLIL